MSSDAPIPSRTNSRQNSLPESRGARRVVSPFRCRVWAQHSRPEEQLTDDACKQLRDSIAKNGQHQPALGRPVSDESDCEIEIICGARRHAVARSLGRDLLVEVRHLTDADAYVAMYEENLLREGDSPYVRGQILLRALRSGTYASQEDLAFAFSLSHSRVSRLLMVAQLPSVVVAAFQSPRDIRENWGVKLYQLCRNDSPEHLLTRRARALANKPSRLSGRETYERLTTDSAMKRGHGYRRNRSVPVLGTTGEILFREHEQIDTVVFIVPKTKLTDRTRDALRQAMAHILELETAPRHEHSASMHKLS